MAFMKEILSGLKFSGTEPPYSSRSKGTTTSPLLPDGARNYGAMDEEAMLECTQDARLTSPNSTDLEDSSCEAFMSYKLYNPSNASSDADTDCEEDGEEESDGCISQDVIRDGIIGGSDGLTVPFALTAGLSAFGDTKIVVNGGMAELIAGMISMGIGGYLAAQSEIDYYNHMLEKTRRLVTYHPHRAEKLVHSIFTPYHVPRSTIYPLVHHLQTSSTETYAQFVLCHKYNLTQPSRHQAMITAFTIALGYLVGGMVSLGPYFFIERDEVMKGFWASCVVMAMALFIFGWGKMVALRGWKTTGLRKGIWEGLKMVALGGLAAGCAYGSTRLFEGEGHTPPGF